VAASRYQKQLAAVTAYKKWELEDMLDELIALPTMKNRIYKLDIRVAASGNEILRLPPYHW